jgi:integrase/recombinase XerD
MSELQKALKEYLAIRRALGFKLDVQGGLLHRFIDFAEGAHASFITRDLALVWATSPKECQPAQWANRLAVLRRFAEYRSAADPRTEIPPRGLLPHCFCRKTPYIYSDDEIIKLIGAAKKLSSPMGLRAATYSTLFGLLAVTGMRRGEPIALNNEDVDTTEDILIIRQAKFGKSRLVPLHPSTSDILRRYAKFRDRLFPTPRTQSFFVSEHGTRLTRANVNWTFIKISRWIGLRSQISRDGPRIHDLRHGFAIRTLIRLYRTTADVEPRLPALATYLGHSNVLNTLSVAPENWAIMAPEWPQS